MNSKSIKKILVVRNDKLGDLMLAFSAFALIKRSLPDTEIVVLVSDYTKDIALACEWVDRVIVDLPQKASLLEVVRFARSIKKQNFAAAITLFSTTRVGILLKLAGIPYRLAPATKIAQIFYNHRLRQKRSESKKPEYEYNNDLIRWYLTSHDFNPADITRPLLHFPEHQIVEIKKHFIQQQKIPSHSIIIFLHPGSGGSASNLSIQQFAKLACSLATNDKYTIVVTAGPGEQQQSTQLVDLLTERNIQNRLYESKQGIVNFAQHIQFADLFISGSTGPLHIAGALDTPTVGFYPKRRSATPLRWQTLNTAPRRLAFSPPADANENDMSSIDLESVAENIKTHFDIFRP